MHEELGVTGLDLAHRDRVEYRADVGGGMVEHEVVDIFVAEAPRDLDITPDPSEVAEVRWIGLHDLIAEAGRHPERFTPWLKIYLDRHVRRIFGSRIAV